MNFGEKLKQLRQQAGLSQPGLADAVGIEQSYLSKLENGKSQPSPDMLQRLMEAMDVSMETLLEGIDEPEIEKQLLGIPQVSAHINQVEAAAATHRKRWLMGSLFAISLGWALFLAGAGALLFTDYYIDYEYVSQALVPKGANGQEYNSIESYVWASEGSRARESGEDLSVADFSNLTSAREQQLFELNIPKFNLQEDFQGNQYFSDATPEEVRMLEAAGFTSGGSRYFELADTVTRYRPENGRLIFAGWLVMLLGAAGLAYTLLHRWISKSR